MDVHRRSFLAAAALGLGGAAAVRAVAAPIDLFPVVETAQGKLRGLSAGGVKMFKGIRYGGETSGKHRFMPPPPPPKWAGVREAFDYGQVAPQMPNSRQFAYAGMISFDLQPGGMGEDCLVLNLWTSTLEPGAKRPVLVHVHGGGFYGGSGNSPGFDGEALARYGDCVVITVNHRLGAFGYMNLADQGERFAASGAVGMMDLTAALAWVRENVAVFGGDPSRVLVFGQSGGGAKTSVLMSMPSAKGLFQRAGVMSGSLLRLSSAEAARKGADGLLKTLGLTRGDTAKLQALPFETLLSAQAVMEADDRAKGEAPRSFSPSIDGVVIPGHPFDPAAPAISAEVPMIISSVLDERAYRLPNWGLNEAGLRAVIARRVGEARADEVQGMYRQESPKATPFILQARFETDEMFRKASIAQTERKAAQGGAPVWSYLWRYPSTAYGGRYGAAHGIDVGPSLHDVRGGLNGFDADNLRLADQLASAWVSFAATGDPNQAKTPAWPAYSLPDRTTMVFDRESRAENDPRRPFREFWNGERSAPA